MSKYDAMGYATLDELNNVFTVKKTELIEKILPYCPTVEARSDATFIVEFVESIFDELKKRMKYNVEDYVRRNPAVKREDRELKNKESEERNRTAYESRRTMGRAVAMGQQG